MLKEYIKFSEAIKTVLDEPVTPRTVKLPILKSLGLVVSEDLQAPYSLPPFPSSAMDGYALRSTDADSATQKNPSKFVITGTSFAGEPHSGSPGPGEAVRILTGAVLPEGLDAVIKEEDVKTENNKLFVPRPVAVGENIRSVGEDISKGEVAIPTGSELTPFRAARVASLGFMEIPVFAPPKISVVSTGNELVEQGKALGDGQIYDSNRITIMAELHAMGVNPLVSEHVLDDRSEVLALFSRLLGISEVVVITGGVSVSNRDLVRQAMDELDVVPRFHGVNQKPGKPLYYGRRDDTHVFGLPGNPVATALTFYIYVFPLIRRLMGYRHPQLPHTMAQLTKPHKEKSNRTTFVRGRVELLDHVLHFHPLAQQESHIIASLSQCDAMAIFEGPKGAGQEVEVMFLPWNVLLGQEPSCSS